jgi:hypothetical protein
VTDLADLFSRDPLSFTKEGGEVRLIIEAMRAKRAQFNLGNIKAGSTKPLTVKQKELLSVRETIGDSDL